MSCDNKCIAIFFNNYKSVNNVITDFKLNNATLTSDEMKEMLMKAVREYDMTQLSVF